MKICLPGSCSRLRRAAPGLRSGAARLRLVAALALRAGLGRRVARARRRRAAAVGALGAAVVPQVAAAAAVRRTALPAALCLHRHGLLGLSSPLAQRIKRQSAAARAPNSFSTSQPPPKPPISSHQTVSTQASQSATFRGHARKGHFFQRVATRAYEASLCGPGVAGARAAPLRLLRLARVLRQVGVVVQLQPRHLVRRGAQRRGRLLLQVECLRAGARPWASAQAGAPRAADVWRGCRRARARMRTDFTSACSTLARRGSGARPRRR